MFSISSAIDIALGVGTKEGAPAYDEVGVKSHTTYNPLTPNPLIDSFIPNESSLGILLATLNLSSATVQIALRTH